MNKLIPLCIVAIVAGCHNINNQQNISSYILKGDTIVIKENSTLLKKISIDTVKYEPYKMKLAISGIVRAIPNSYAEVASPFAGRITRSFIRLGQFVSVNSPIFEISSPSFFEAGKYYYQAKQEMQLAEKNLKRQKDLLANGVGIQKDVEEAEVNFELTKRDLENSIASLSVFHVNPDELVLGQPLIVRSPIQGEIVENEIVLGQYLKEDAGPVAIVAELSKVWVIGQLKEKDINSVHKTDEVTIKPTGIPDIKVTGMVYHIGEILDDETRSVQVFIECDNNNRILKPGMYVTVQFSDSTGFSILIPTSSVLQNEESCFVFLQSERNRFVRHAVEIAGTENNRTIIKSGLHPGDRIISQGGILLLEAK